MHKTITMATITAALLTPLGARAQEAELVANGAWVSQYYFRGVLQKTSSASAGLDLALGPVYLGSWAGDVGDGTEINLYGGLAVDVGALSLSAGGKGYYYPNDFDDTYLEANFLAGAGPLSVEFSIGEYEGFGDEQDYWFLGITAEREGFFGTFGTFGYDFKGSYGEAGYGFSAADLDFTISGILSDRELSDTSDGKSEFTIIFGVSKTLNINLQS